MALKFDQVLRPRPELLVIRQTRLEPTLMIVFGLVAMGMGVFVFVQTTSGIWFELSFPEQLLQALIIRFEAFMRMFEEGFYSNMNTANIVTFVFSSLFILFCMVLFGSGIRRLLNPIEHQFDQREKTYFRNGNMIARFDEIQDIYIRRRTSSSEGSTSTWYQLYLVLQSRKPIKLMKTSSGERALELVSDMTSAIGMQTEQAKEDGSAGPNTFLDKSSLVKMADVANYWFVSGHFYRRVFSWPDSRGFEVLDGRIYLHGDNNSQYWL